MADRRAYNRDVQGNWELVRHDPEKADVYAVGPVIFRDRGKVAELPT